MAGVPIKSGRRRAREIRAAYAERERRFEALIGKRKRTTPKPKLSPRQLAIRKAGGSYEAAMGTEYRKRLGL